MMRAATIFPPSTKATPNHSAPIIHKTLKMQSAKLLGLWKLPGINAEDEPGGEARQRHPDAANISARSSSWAQSDRQGTSHFLVLAFTRRQVSSSIPSFGSRLLGSGLLRIIAVSVSVNSLASATRARSPCPVMLWPWEALLEAEAWTWLASGRIAPTRAGRAPGVSPLGSAPQGRHTGVSP